MKTQYVTGIVLSLILIVIMSINGFICMSNRQQAESKGVPVIATVYDTEYRLSQRGFSRRYVANRVYKMRYKYIYGGEEHKYTSDDWHYKEMYVGTQVTFYIDPSNGDILVDAEGHDAENGAFIIAGAFFINLLFQLIIGLRQRSYESIKGEAVKYIGFGLCAAITWIGLAFKFSFLVRYMNVGVCCLLGLGILGFIRCLKN